MVNLNLFQSALNEVRQAPRQGEFPVTYLKGLSINLIINFLKLNCTVH